MKGPKPCVSPLRFPLGWLVVGFLAVFAITGPASATLISNNCGFSGPGDCTLDTATNLQWLDLTESTTLSFNFVSTQFGPGGQFEGYRYALVAEVFTLFTNAGFTNVGSAGGLGNFLPENLAPYAPFVALLGETSPDGPFPSTRGFSGDFESASILRAPFVEIEEGCCGRALDQPQPNSLAAQEFGSWLIRGASFIPVFIDIKPGNEKNNVNICAKGVLPVAILSSETFDAPAEVDPITVSLEGAGVKTVGKDGRPLPPQTRDVNGDGLADLIVKIAREGLGLEPGDTEAELTGQTFGGMPIEGTGAVEVKQQMCIRTLE